MGDHDQLTLYQKVMARVTGKSPLYDQYPDLAGRIPLASYGGVGFGEGVNANLYQWHYNTLAWSSNPWVMKAIKVIGDDIGGLQNIRVVKDRGDGNLEPVDHWVNDLLQNVNPERSGAEVWKQWASDMMLGGEAGMELTRNAARTQWGEAWMRQPIHFSVRPDHTKGGSRYQAVDSYWISDQSGGDPYGVAPEDFIHFKFYNPYSVWRGISIMSALRMGVSIDAMAQAWQYGFFKNNARPDYAIISEQGMAPGEKDELRTEIRGQLGRQDSHGIVVLEKEIQDIKTFDFAKVDNQWVEERKLSREEIGGVFGIPDEIMGFGKDTYENFNTADRVKWTLTMVPLIKFRDDGLTHHLRRRVGILEADEFIRTDVSKVPQLQEDKTAKIGQVKDLWSMGTPFNQASEFIGLGIEDIPGGDTGWLPFSVVPVEAAAARGDEGDEGDGDKAVTAPQFETVEGKMIRGIEYDSEAHHRFYEAKQRRITQPAKAMGRVLKKYFQEQQDFILAQLREALDKQAKGEDDIPDLVQVFDIENQLISYEDHFLELSLRIFRNLMGLSWDELPADQIEAINSELFLDAPEVTSQVEAFLSYQAQEINRSTFVGLQSVFEAGINAGDNLSGIMDRVSEYYKGRKSPYQIERITRTSMTGIDNSARQLAWDQSKVVKDKEWISALLANRTRDAHAAAHGQVVALNAMFEVGGEPMLYPGDPQGSAGNVINCLCTTRAVVEGSE